MISAVLAKTRQSQTVLFGIFACGLFSLYAAEAFAAPAYVSVSADGTGDFASIQSALDSLSVAGRERVVLRIRNGVYNEKIRINRSRVTLRGESRSGVRIEYWLPRSEYDKRYDDRGPAVVNVFGNDVVIENLTIDNVQQSTEHAFTLYGQPNRLILNNCDVLGNGGDTVSLWNTPHGMYYHFNCRFRGGVDFVCPRGWCYIRNSEFECPTTSAAIWHDGHMDYDMKFVLRNCKFDGVKNFWLGRNHYPAQFYLLDCTFGENLADKPIETVKELRPDEDATLYERKFFHNCHREGGDYRWHADNLAQAPGKIRADEISAAWTFDREWDPESEQPPVVRSVEFAADQVYLYLSEPVAGAHRARVVRSDGSEAEYRRGSGTNQLLFSGGSVDSKPVKLELSGDQIYGTVASLELRYLVEGHLPEAMPRQQVKLLLIGDSTVADYDATSSAQGWGNALPHLFDDRVVVSNWAKNGRSSKSFRDEGWWDKARQEDADYVFIQFGHNDNPGKGPERYTNPEPGGDYRDNLKRYVKETRAMGAEPILVTPPTRRFYETNGQIGAAKGNVPYAQATLAVAEEVGCPCVDLNRLSRDLFNRLGEASSDWMQPVGDRTHWSPRGARRIAALVVEEVQAKVPELGPFVLPDVTTTLTSASDR